MVSLNDIKMSLITLLNEVKPGLNIFAEDIEHYRGFLFVFVFRGELLLLHIHRLTLTFTDFFLSFID